MRVPENQKVASIVKTGIGINVNMLIKHIIKNIKTILHMELRKEI